MDVFDRLDFTNNCTLASYYIANWFYLEPGINITVEYIYSALNPADGATFLEVLSWFLSVTNGGDVYSFESKWFHRAIELPYERCQAEVLVAYYVEAAMVTAFFIILLVDQLKYGRPTPPTPRTRRNFLDSVHSAVKPFLDGTILFSLSVLAASIAQNARILLHLNQKRPLDTTKYENVLSQQLALFSIFPAIILDSLNPWPWRQWLRRAVWTLIVIMAVAAIAVARTAGSRDDEEDIWELMCDADGGLRIRQALIASFVLFPVTFVFWHAFIRNTFGIQRLERSTFFRKLRPFWPSIVATLCCVGMWTLLALFAVYRGKLISTASNGTFKDEEDEWKFGQFLALATWLPVFVEFGYVFGLGTEQGLRGRLGSAWEVRRAPEG